jgi:hypothetical protein
LKEKEQKAEEISETEQNTRASKTRQNVQNGAFKGRRVGR